MQQRSRLGACSRGVVGALVMALSLGTAIAIGDIARTRVGVSGAAEQWLQAVVCSALAVPLIVVLRRELDRRPMEGLGLPSPQDSVRTFALGVLVTGSAAAATFGVGGTLGWVRFGAISWAPVLMFVAVNTPIAFFYEALPEELTLRGYAYRNLNARLRRWTAAVGTVALFLIVPAAGSVIGAAVGSILGGPVRPPSLAPAGDDPIAYLILLTIFGATLIVARIATGSLWTAIASHLTFLTVNRLVLEDSQLTGWSVTLASPDAILLIPAYLLIAAGVFVVLARWQGRRLGWRDRDPEP